MSGKTTRATIFNKVSKYSEYIARRYYTKYYSLFLDDSFSLSDLLQEAKMTCIKIFKKYYKYHGINNFDIQKFTSRAVGWRMRDLMRQAVTERKNTIHQSKMIVTKSIGGESVLDNAVTNFTGYDEDDIYEKHIMSSILKHGFIIEDLFKLLSKKDLTILKYVLKYEDVKKRHILKYFKNIRCGYRYWNKNLKPRLTVIMLDYNNERINHD